jgi:hypothetical protein
MNKFNTVDPEMLGATVKKISRHEDPDAGICTPLCYVTRQLNFVL